MVDGKGESQTLVGPEDIFNYAYAIFRSHTYRSFYSEFLKVNDPRLPLTSDKDLFDLLARKGVALVALRLMESPELNTPISKYEVRRDNEVGKVNYVAKNSARLHQ